MSSPMMTRMFGFCCGCCAEEGGAIVTVARIASRTDHRVILMGFPSRASNAPIGRGSRQPMPAVQLASNSLAQSVRALLSLGAGSPAAISPPLPKSDEREQGEHQQTSLAVCHLLPVSPSMPRIVIFALRISVGKAGAT